MADSSDPAPTTAPKPTLRERMTTIQARDGVNNPIRLAIALAPSLAKMPYPLQRYDDPFLPYSKAVIDTTADLTAAYVFDLAAYLSVGASGAIALERAIAYVPSTCMTILHGTFADPTYADLLAPTAFNTDAATVSPDLFDIPDGIDRFLRPAHVVFVIRMPRTFSKFNIPDAYSDRVGSLWHNQDHDALAPNHWMVIADGKSPPGLLWGWYGDSIALAGRGEDFADVIRQAAIVRRDWLAAHIADAPESGS